MQFGLFYQLPCADSQSETARYQETVEQIVAATRWAMTAHGWPSCTFLSRFPLCLPPSLLPPPWPSTLKRSGYCGNCRGQKVVL
jgi:hypothetical protein